MRLLRSFPPTVLAMVLLGIIGFCAVEQSVKLLAVALILAGASWRVTEGPRARTLPRWVANLLVIAVVVSVIVDLLLPPDDIAGVLGRFCIWLTLIKLYQRRTARDHAQLMALSLLLVFVGCLRSQALPIGVILVLYAVTGLHALLLYRLYAAHEAVIAAHRGGGAARPGPPPAPTIGRHVALHFRGLAAGVGVIGLLLSVVVFVLFPRTIWRGVIAPSFRVAAAERTTGYRDEIDLDAGTRITTSRRVVFDVQVGVPEGLSLDVSAPLYLRGAVLDRYDRGRWTASSTRRRRLESGAGAPAHLAREPDPGAPRIEQSFRFRQGTTTVFGLYAPVSIRTESPHRFAYERTTQTLQSVDSGVLYGYALASCPDPSPALAASLARRRGAGPRRTSFGFVRGVREADARRVGGLARALLEEAGVAPAPPAQGRWAWNAEAARVLERFLQSEAFRYTLDVSDVVRDETDPVISFLFESRRGHCEFHASALVAMCHTVGIDARIVTGFVAGEYDEDADRFVVRDANAHAWVEVPIGSHRMLTLDPTPSRELAIGADEPDLAARAERLYERLEGSWTSRVVQFDGRSQARLLETLDAGWSERGAAVARSIREWMAQVNRGFYFGPAGYIWMALVASALLIALVALVRMLRRYRMLRRVLRLGRVPGPASRRFARQLGFYSDMLAALRRRGRPKPVWQPPQAFAATLAHTEPAVAGTIGRIAGLYYAARFSGRRLTTDEVREARRLVRELDGRLGAGG